MNRSKSLIGCLFLLCVALPSASQENHRNEPGTGILLARSTFAHGYRHGYEEGFHQGNIDINMTRRARTKFSELRGVPLGYQPDFGPRNSFLYGFQFGLMAGYADGYSGKEFRAISNLRSAAAGLGRAAADGQSSNRNFDRGLIFGYSDGLGRDVEKKNQVKKDLMKDKDMDSGRQSCRAAAEDSHDSAGQAPDYCEGYRRGLGLGRADASAAGPDHAWLEASK